MTQNSGISLGSGKDNASGVTQEWLNASSSTVSLYAESSDASNSIGQANFIVNDKNNSSFGGMYVNAPTPFYGYSVAGSPKAWSKYEESGSDKYMTWSIDGSDKMRLDGDGNLEVSKEINTHAGGSANMVPIAYGTIDGAGSCSNCSNNISAVSFYGGSNHWEISIDNETFNYSDYTTLVTPFTTSSGSTSVIIPSVGSVNNNLIVNLYSVISDAKIEGIGFSFVIYKK